MGTLDTTGVAGWLRLLCLLLTIWEPLSFAVVAAASVNAVQVRGVGVALVLGARFVAAALCVAAGRSMLDRRASGVALAKAALATSALVQVLSSLSPFLPSNRMPGDTPIYSTMTLVYYGAWLLYLMRSKRVAATFV